MDNVSITGKFVIRIDNDSDLVNPNDYGTDNHGWEVISFLLQHRNSVSYDSYILNFDNDNIRIGLQRKLQCGTAYMLSYYDHSIGVWSIAGREGYQHHASWDRLEGAGILIWKGKPKELDAGTQTINRMDGRLKSAQDYLRDYNAWSNGFGLWYSIEYVPENDSDTIDIESVGGYYSHDNEYMEDEIISAIKSWGITQGIATSGNLVALETQSDIGYDFSQIESVLDITGESEE